MSKILWEGEPDYWTPTAWPGGDDKYFRIGATDDGVVAAALHEEESKLSISKQATINCLARDEFRRCLGHSLFNLTWESFTWYPRSVAKAPASALNNGVTFLRSDDAEIARLTMLGITNPRGVIEEFVEGDAIEVTGVRLLGRTSFFPVIRQHWNADWTCIESYSRTSDHWWLPEFTDKALDLVGLDNSCFSAEWRVTGYKEARLLEINPRPGDENKNYAAVAWGAESPCAFVEAAAIQNDRIRPTS